MLTLVLVALAMIRIPSKSRAIAMWFYILMYMFIIFGYSAEALSFLVDLSIYSYNDVIGVLYGIADFNLQFKWAAIDLGIGVIIFLGVLNFRFKKNDII